MMLDEDNNIRVKGSETYGIFMGSMKGDGPYYKLIIPGKSAAKIKDFSLSTVFAMFLSNDSNEIYFSGNSSMYDTLDYEKKDGYLQTVKLEEGVKCLKICAAKGNVAFIIVEKAGKNELWSVGSHQSGLLGQDTEVKESKTFLKIKCDEGLEFVDVSAGKDHAIGITKDGKLYAWGSNTCGLLGIREENKEYLDKHVPTPIPFFDDYKIHEVSCSTSHTMVLASHKEDSTNFKKVFTFGLSPSDSTNLSVLGVTEEYRDSNPDAHIFEIKYFNNREIASIRAGDFVSFATTETTNLDKLHCHENIDCVSCNNKIKGSVHLTNSNGNIKTYCVNCIQKVEEPISFAYKCPIDDFKNKAWPHIPDIKEYIDMEESKEESKEGGDVVVEHTGKICVECGDSPIRGPMYLANTTVSGEKVDMKLCQKCFAHLNITDVNPLIFYRVEKPVLKDLPKIDLESFYKLSEFFGIEMNVTPDYSYKPSKKLRAMYESLYQESEKSLEESNEKEAEIYDKINQHAHSSQTSNFEDWSIETVYGSTPIPDGAEFRFKTIQKFYSKIKDVLPILYFPLLKDIEYLPDTLVAAYFRHKDKIPDPCKSELFRKLIGKLETKSNCFELPMNRMKAHIFAEAGKVDYNGDQTVFAQVHKKIREKRYENLHINSSSDKAWNSKFIGEGGYDAGGLFRESVAEICKELQSAVLPLFVRTPNQKNDFGENREKWTVSSSAQSPVMMELYESLGALMGFSIRSTQVLDLDLPSMFWKSLIDDPLDKNDLAVIDSYCVQCLEDITKLGQSCSPEEFNENIQECFVTCLSDGSEVELLPGGKQKKLTHENYGEYVKLVEKARLNESKRQMEAVKKGISYICPLEFLKLLTWKEVEYRVVGEKTISVEALKKMTTYSGYSESDDVIGFFWEVFQGFTQNERSLYLRFVWGRSRLPITGGGDTQHKIERLHPTNPDMAMPIAHTCFFSIDIPAYSAASIMREKLLYAINFCSAIDNDGSPYEISGEADEEEE